MDITFDAYVCMQDKLFLSYVFFLVTKLFSNLVVEKIQRPINRYAVFLVVLQQSKF